MNYYVICWEKYADFSGRARREEYWMFQLFNAIIAIILFFVGQNLSIPIDGIGNFNFLLGIYNLLIIIPSLAVTVRRLHDTNNSGWMTLIAVIPIVGWIWFFVLSVTEGDVKKNKYGKNPKKNTNEQKTSEPEDEILSEPDTIIEENGIKNPQIQTLNKIKLLEESFKLGLITETELKEKKMQQELVLKREEEEQFKLNLRKEISKDVDVLKRLKNEGLLTHLEYTEKVKALYASKKLEEKSDIKDESTDEYTYDDYLSDISKDESSDSQLNIGIGIVILIFIIGCVIYVLG